MLIAGGALAGIGSTMSFGSAQALFPVDNGGASLVDSLEPVASATPTAGQTSQVPNPTATSATTTKPNATASTKATPTAKATTTKKPTVKPTKKPSPTPAPTKKNGPVDGDYTGVSARAGVYGNVQVQIRVAGGVITAIAVPVMPTRDRESVNINSWAVPDLKAVALSSQSANISSLSGATYTSRAFAKSLQSALTQAGL